MAAWPRPTRPRATAAATYRVQPMLRPNPVYRRVAQWLERTPRARRWFTAAERRGKEALFGCRMCGQCALPATGYACTMTCPKQLRNGPCGGVAPNGDCEVYPGETCVWVIAHERAASAGRGADLARLQRPVDHRLAGTSSWVNYWLGRDEDLWTADDGLRTAPPIGRVDLGMPTVRAAGPAR
ncbi:MAG: methylenetetrahydrofolate reductase C-terminal domain-containing protein [Pseudonocardia sp.]